MEREWSVTSMIVARSIGTATERCGRARPTTRAAIDASSSVIGTKGRHVGTRPMAERADAIAVKADRVAPGLAPALPPRGGGQGHQQQPE